MEWKKKSGCPRKADVDEKLIVKRYSEVKSSKILAEEFGVSIGTIIRILRGHGVVVGKSGPERIKLNIQDDELKERYLAGESATKIGDSIQQSHFLVEKRLKELGVKFRGMSALGHVDEHFFDVIDTEQKAYWLGFLAADVTFGSRGVVDLTLGEVDILHLDKYKSDLKITSKVRKRVRDAVYKVDGKVVRIAGDKKNIGYMVSFRSVVLNRAGVAKLGLTQQNKSQKSKYLVFNPDLFCKDKSLIRHAWRGIVDGDGCICTTKDFQVKLTGTKGTCDNFGMFCDNIIKTNSNSIFDKSCNIWSYSVYGDAGRKVAEVLYGNSIVYLDRKKIKALNENTIQIVPISRESTERFLKETHYLGDSSLPQAVSIYAWMDDREILGVAVVGQTSSLYSGFKEYGVLELRRFSLKDDKTDMPKNAASFFLAKVIALQKGKCDLLISYADNSARHIGKIYQATNFNYLGCSDSLRYISPDGGVFGGGRNLVGSLPDDLTGYTVEKIKDKHKYIYVLSRENKELMEKIRLISKPYPK